MAQARIIKIADPVMDTLLKVSTSCPNFISRNTSPNTNAYKAATAAASVGVKIPDQMPPMMITGVRMGKKAF